MPVVINSGDIYFVKVYCSAGDQLAVNTLHYSMTDKVGTVTDVDFLNHWVGMAAWPIAWKALLSDDATFRGTQVGRIFPKPPTRPNHTITGAGVGTVVGEILPRQVSGIISHQTDFAGPRYRGRVYVPFPSEASSEAVLGTPVAAYVTALDTLGAILQATQAITPGGANSINAHPVILHRDAEPPEVSFIVESFGREKWATQRRRGSYGSPNEIPF